MWKISKNSEHPAGHMVAILLVFAACVAGSIVEGLTLNSQDIGRFPILMPNVHPSRNELYLCTPVKVDYTKSYYIVGFDPNATMDTAHHMLLYGCGEPGKKRAVWDCGEMSQNDNTVFDAGSPCGEGSHSQIIYAWARDASKLDLPTDVGFKVGADSPIKYIVLQVHYAHKFNDEKLDDSGIFVHYTLTPMPKQAGIFLLGTAGMIGPNMVEYMDSSCEMHENKTIYPFAYRTHTHGLGKVVSGYRVRKDKYGNQQWLLLGKRNPLTPQMFYPIENKDPINYGDILASRCTMESHRSRITYIGATNEDEMCNFYIMYYVENDEPLNTKYCFTPGPPFYRWNRNDTGLKNIPEYDSSHL